MSNTLVLAPAERDAVAYSLPAPEVLLAPVVVAPHVLRRRRERLVEHLFQWGMGALMFLSGAVAMYRILWMGQ